MTVSCPEISSVTFLYSRSLFSFITPTSYYSPFLHVQRVFRNLTAITQGSTAKFFTAISGCNYRNDLKLTHREFFFWTKGWRWVRKLPMCPSVGPVHFIAPILTLQVLFLSFFITRWLALSQSDKNYTSHTLCPLWFELSSELFLFLTISNGSVCHLGKYLLRFWASNEEID